MSVWYVFDQGANRGPFSEEEFFAYVRGKNPNRIHFWREGLAAWVLAKDIPALVDAMKPDPSAKPYVLAPVIVAAAQRIARNEGRAIPRHAPAAPLAPAAVEIRADIRFDAEARFNNVIARHWRGELPLWISYWVLTVLPNALLGAIPLAALAAIKIDTGYYPPAIFALLMAIWIAVIIPTVWQTVGVWRSARQYVVTRKALGRHAVFGRLAQFAVIGGIFLFSGAMVKDGIPQFYALYRIAFMGDPDIPPYSIRVMSSGTEAEISGGIKHSLTDDFSKILRASPQIKVVHLYSIGGRVGEGEKLFNLIRERKLNTYVSSECASACTLAFAGGHERYLAKGAKLGFHRGAFPGASDDELDSTQFDVFRQSGFDPSFIARVLATPNKTIWQPSADILLQAKVVTGVVESTRFATSGLSAVGKEEIVKSLRKAFPFAASLQRKYPEKFDELVNGFYDAAAKGTPEADSIAAANRKMTAIVGPLLPQADDDVLVDLSKLLAEQYAVLNRRNPSHCYSYALGAEGSLDYVAELPDELQRRERDLYARAIETAMSRPVPDAARLDGLQENLREGLAAKGMTESEWKLVESADLEPSKHALYCELTILLYREISQLPKKDAALFMRKFLAGK